MPLGLSFNFYPLLWTTKPTKIYITSYLFLQNLLRVNVKATLTLISDDLRLFYHVASSLASVRFVQRLKFYQQG